METDWDSRREMEDRLLSGDGISIEEARSLISDADAGERSQAVLEGLTDALRQRLGIVVVDASTDDGVVIELVNAVDVAVEGAIRENVR